jgi:hypothetical protein
MSAIITGKVFWTDFLDLSYLDKNRKQVNIKETTAKIVMLSIADSADDFGENSWQSFKTIAKKSSIKRRSVIRVVRALIEHNYLKIVGITRYGTNNFSINLEKLGEPPKSRAKVGRPKIGDPQAIIGDPQAIIGDPQAIIGDPQSPYPSFNHPKLSYKEAAREKKTPNPTRKTAAKVRGDALNGLLFYGQQAQVLEIPPQLYDYPPSVQEIVKLVWEFFGLDIPEKSMAGRSGEYGKWIEGAEAINSKIGDHGKRTVIARVHGVWNNNPWTVSHPGALLSSIASEVGKLNLEKRKSSQTISVDQRPGSFANVSKAGTFMSNPKK